MILLLLTMEWSTSGKRYGFLKLNLIYKFVFASLLIVDHHTIKISELLDSICEMLCIVVYWNTLDRDFKKFYDDTCLACASANGSREMLRPFGFTVPATKPNEVLEFDFLYVNNLPASGTTHKYECILVLRDKYSKFVWLHPCVAANSQAIIEALLQWHALFGVAPTWVSDRGSHFLNEVMTELNRQSGITIMLL
jgi:hypothetical protein